ncbi:hypothetical protein Tco_1540569 [Tanacetum coccineum]
MSSPNRFTSDLEDVFSSMNFLNYISVSSDYFPALLESRSFNFLENSTDNIIPPVFSLFYNNPCLKDVQAFYAKELPISSPDPITPPAYFYSISGIFDLERFIEKIQARSPNEIKEDLLDVIYQLESTNS